MKPSFENVEQVKGAASFVVYEYQTKHFPFKWHYHPEYELTLIVSGKGKRLVGDSYNDFFQDDLVFIGAGVPHTWASEPDKKNVFSIVIQFSQDVIQPFLQFPECKGIAALLKASEKGLYFKKKQAIEVIEKIKALPQKTDLEKLLTLIELLGALAKLPATALSSSVISYQKYDITEQRINKVSQYVYNNYKQSIPVKAVAAKLHLTAGAFCKFFKKATGKTFSDYVNDVRIGKATTLLLETDETIATIASKVGYESISYFNRVFYAKKNATPGSFRRQLKMHLAV